MRSEFEVVDAKLRRTARRWRWLRLVERASVLGAVTCGLAVLWGLMILRGWITSRSLGVVMLVLLALLSLLGLFTLLLITIVTRLDTERLADAVEHSHRGMLDRLHTLVFLSGLPADQQPWHFKYRIGRQAERALVEERGAASFPSRRAWLSFLALVVCFLGMVVFYVKAPVWDRLAQAAWAKANPPAEAEKPPSLELPPAVAAEQQEKWGEVRITEPGADLKVTKVDVVPLQIEAAASDPLTNIAWLPAINGGVAKTNRLPPAPEPRYAVHKPTVYLDEMQLADWDVVTYYAKAGTVAKDSYASQLYFLEVRPFREDIMKLPGGENGEAYECLSQLTGLIEDQQRIIRETHRSVQSPQPDDRLRAQDHAKLSSAERDLGNQARDLYGRLAAEMENRPIGEALDALAKAEHTLGDAADQLAREAMDDAQSRERQALSELAAARKMFHKSFTENPQDFEPKKSQEEMPPIAEDAKKLKEMAEFRDEMRAAQQFMENKTTEQKSLQRVADALSSPALRTLARQERDLRNSVKEFQDQHPQAFKGTEAESEAASRALENAASQLSQNSEQAKSAMRDAGDALEKLKESLRDHSATEQTAEAHKLRQMLDHEIKTFTQAEQSPQSVPDETLKETAAAARDTVNQLKDFANQGGAGTPTGQAMQKALTSPKEAALKQTLDRVQQTDDALVRKVASGTAKRLLSEVRQAFDEGQKQSQPGSDPLKPSGQDAFATGLAQLQSLIEQMQTQHQTPKDLQQKQAHEALYNLQSAMPQMPGDQTQVDALVAELEKELTKGLDPQDLELLKKLAAQLQRFSAEASEKRGDATPAEVTNIDPNKLPPAYRSRISKYFEKLSAK